MTTDRRLTVRETPQRPAPTGLRWATGGGSQIGGCNAYHLARKDIRGTLCGRYGPATPPDPPPDARTCKTCERLAGLAVTA